MASMPNTDFREINKDWSERGNVTTLQDLDRRIFEYHLIGQNSACAKLKEDTIKYERKSSNDIYHVRIYVINC